MATITTSLTCTTDIVGFERQSNGDYRMRFNVLNADGSVRRTHTYLLKADGTGVSEEGAQIAGSTPANILADLTKLWTDTNTALDNAVAAGKVTV